MPAPASHETAYATKTVREQRAIASGLLTVGLFVFLASIARFAKEAVIAYRYGTSAEVDAYVFLFTMVNWPASVWFSVLTAVLLPLAARIQLESPHQLPQFRKELLGLSLFVALVLGLCMGIGLRVLIGSPLIGLSPNVEAHAREMMSGMVFLTPLGIVIGLLSASILSNNRHINTLLEAIPPVVLTFVLLAFPVGTPLMWGTLIGFVLHLTALFSTLRRQQEFQPPSLRPRSPYWGKFWKAFLVMLAGQALMALSAVIDQLFAARLGEGAIAALNYGNRVLAVILSLGAMAVSRATLPVFSRLEAAGKRRAQRLAMRWVLYLFVFGATSMTVAFFCAPWLVRLAFERGAFTALDAQHVTEILRVGLAQLPFFFAGLVIANYFASRRLYFLLFWSGVIGLTAKVVGNLALTPVLGVAGITGATAFAYAATFTYFLLVLFKASSSPHLGLGQSGS